MGAMKRAPASSRPPRGGGGGRSGGISSGGGGTGSGGLAGADGGRGVRGSPSGKGYLEASGRPARGGDGGDGLHGRVKGHATEASGRPARGGDGGDGLHGRGKGHAAEASGRPARGGEKEQGTGGTPRGDGGAGSGGIPGGSGEGRSHHHDVGKEGVGIGGSKEDREDHGPFSGLLVLCIDLSSSKPTEEVFHDYKQKVEGLGGTFGSGINYNQATHIAVMGEIPPGARSFWEGEAKKVTKCDWIDECFKERRLLPIEAKGSCENLLSQPNETTPVSNKSYNRKCMSTIGKEMKHATRSRSRTARKLDFSAHRSNFHRHLVCESESEVTEKLYDYALRYRLHEYSELPGCEDMMFCEEDGTEIVIPKSVKLSKLSTKVVVMRCFKRLARFQQEGFSLGGQFSSKNFTIYADDSVKLEDLVDGSIVVYSDDNGDLDYKQFVQMVKKEVFLEQKLPFDLTEWLRIISQGVRACHRALLCNHIDLMEPYQAYGQFVSMYQIFWNVKGTPGWSDLLGSLGHYSGWMSEGVECSFIAKTLEYKDDNIGHEVDYEDDVRGLLRVLNNTFKHRAKAHQRLAVYIIMNEFRRFLSDLQRALHQGGYLSHLSVDNS